MGQNQSRIELLCFGSELLRDKVNSNANEIADRLFSIGFLLNRITTVGDQKSDIELSLKESLKRADVIITCGGLGPTFDDLTRESVSKVLKKSLLFSKEIFVQIEKRFVSAGMRMAEENKKQAYFISGARVLKNRVGTAPGQIIQLKDKSIILLPGPLNELVPMMEEDVCPYLKKRYGGTLTRSFTLHIFGHPESEIDQRIDSVVKKYQKQKGFNVIFAILAHQSIVDVKVTIQGKKSSDLRRALSKIREEFREVLGDDIYGEDEETLESVIGKILKEKRETLSIAESCTGGLVSSKVTNVPGSSLYFKEGVVAYTNESKMRLLDVQKETLEKFGSVSCPTAEEMAKTILKNSSSDWAISVTGIAGPGGGSSQKPIGLVCFGIASKDRVDSCCYNFFGSRREIKEKSALMVLELLRKKLRNSREI